MSPPAPVQVNVYVNVDVTGPLVSVPLVAFEPDHAPAAEHDVAFAAFQLIVETPPRITLMGDAESETVGCGLPMETVVLADALSLRLEQLRPNVALIVRGPIDWLPDVVFAPLHAPVPVQFVALDAVQVSREVPPDATTGGFALIETVGAESEAGETPEEEDSPPPHA